MVKMDLSTWQSLRARDPRRIVLESAQWGLSSTPRYPESAPGEQELEAMLVRARDAGIRSIQTARAYPGSEARIGGIVRAVPSSEGWRVLTKLAPDVHETGLGIAETLERVAASLSSSRVALGQDALSVVLLPHFEHRHASGGKLWRTLLAEREAGRIGSLGVCTASPEEAWAALEDPDMEVIQVAASLLDLRLLRQDFFSRARESGRSVYVHDVFLQDLADCAPDALPSFLRDLQGSIQRIRSSAAQYGVTPRSLYLAFVREYLPGVLPIVDCRSAVELEELLVGWESPEIDVARLAPLVDALPTHEAKLVDPTYWPTRQDSAERAGNQTRPPSVATIPS